MPREPHHTAYAIAEKAHAGQFRKAPDNRPYFEHCKDVAAMMPTLELKTVALLHDVIEDTPVTAQDLLAAGIPKPIVDAVVAMTKPEKKDQGGPRDAKGPKAKGAADQQDEVEAYLKYVRKQVLPNEIARKVKLADNYVNMKDRQAAIIAGGPEAEYARKKVEEYVGSIKVLVGVKRGRGFKRGRRGRRGQR